MSDCQSEPDPDHLDCSRDDGNTASFSSEHSRKVSTTSQSEFSSVSKHIPKDEYDGDEDDEDDDDEELEELEPKLKYERLSSDLRSILSDDSASCISVHPKMLLLGTHWGRVHQLDAMGNVVGGVTASGAHHSVAVAQIDIDHPGENVASCSLDGKVAVKALLTGEAEFAASLNKPVRAVSIDPVYYKQGSGKRFMTGDDKVILHERIFLSRYKQTVLCENEGPITSIKWRGRFAAWISNRGVRVYDVIEFKMISLIKKEDLGESRSSSAAGYSMAKNEEVPCRIAWSDQYHLFVAMGDLVRVCVVKMRSTEELLSPRTKDLPQYKVELASSFHLPDLWVSGIAPFGDTDLVVLLVVPKQKTEDGDAMRPQVLVVEPQPGTGYQEVCSDVLSIRGFEKYRPKDYHLECLVEDQHYFIVSPKDIVVGKPRDTDDRIDWLLQHLRFAEALVAAEGDRAGLKRHTVVAVGRQYLDALINAGRYDEAGRLCVRIFGVSRDLWQEEVFKFARYNQLKAVAPFFPVGEHGLRLEPHVYEMALFELMKADAEAFLNTVRAWPPELYSVSAVVKALVEQLLVYPEDLNLQRALATLFTYQEKFDKAMAMYLKLGHEDVFNLIRRHSLYDAVRDKIRELMDLNHEEAVKLFLDNIQHLPPETIVSKLVFHDRYRYLYLDALTAHAYEESKKYHGQLVELYADFDREKLMSFLRLSDDYPPQRALEICEEHCLTAERIYILARVGNTRDALKLITTELADIHRAVEFCKEHDDDDLWTDLIDYSIDKPYFINVLLHNVGTHIKDPAVLIKKIEKGLEIPELRDSLVQILQDYRLQVRSPNMSIIFAITS